MSAQRPAMTCLEICVGAGGQALGLEQAGISHAATVKVDHDAYETLRLNRQHAWKVIEADVRHFDGRPYHGIGLPTGGVSCPPFTVAGKQLGADDERDLLPEALRLVRECEAAAVMLENVPGLAQSKFATYRVQVLAELRGLGYESDWRVLNACDFGVPQLRPRFILVALRPAAFRHFEWPEPDRAGSGRYYLFTYHHGPGFGTFLTKSERSHGFPYRGRNMAHECGNCDRPRRQGLKGGDDGSPQHYVDISST